MSNKRKKAHKKHKIKRWKHFHKNKSTEANSSIDP